MAQIHDPRVGKELVRTNQALRMSSEVQRILCSAESDEPLPADVCRVVVQSGPYALAELGFTSNGMLSGYAPAAQAGDDGGYLAWGTRAEGASPVALALETQTVHVARNLLELPSLADERKRAPKQLAAMAAVPVVQGGQVWGVLQVYAADTDAFGSEEVRVLGDLGRDVAAGLSRARECQERTRQLAELEASNRELRLLSYALDKVSDAVYLMSGVSPFFRYVNEAAVQSLGYTREELLSMSVLDIDSNLDESNWAGLVQAMKELGHGRVESTHIRKDGSTFPIEVTGNVFDFEGDLQNLAIARDITERKDAEAARQVLEDQLRQAQKMEAIGQLAGGVAHDFNNVLLVIQMVAGILKENDPGDTTGRALDEIIAATERAANLTRQLLVFSRRQVVDPVNMDLAESARDMSRLLARVLEEPIALGIEIEEGLPLVCADRGMMGQVVMNLAINARDAMPGGGKLLIKVESTRRSHPKAAADDESALYVCLTVSDTGTGIPPEDMSRIFDPFFTTKAAGKGTGLGLATVFGIVESHGGWIDVDSAVGEGTKFKVFLPAVEGNRAPSVVSEEPTTALEGADTVLLVEDDVAVRAATSTALRRYGYRVLEAESGEAAVALFEERGDDVALLVTDLVMPGKLSGRQLAEAISGRAPELPVLFTSGYSPDFNFSLRLPKGQQLLQKPYSPSTLARAVRRCLDTMGEE